MSNGMSLAIARQLRDRGLSVIPVPRADGYRYDGKTPAMPWRDFQTRLATDVELVMWFGVVSMNLAVVTGALSDVVVIDADSPAAVQWCGRRLPRTPWQTKTARGFHLWYRHPGVRVANRSQLDTR